MSKSQQLRKDSQPAVFTIWSLNLLNRHELEPERPQLPLPTFISWAEIYELNAPPWLEQNRPVHMFCVSTLPFSLALALSSQPSARFTVYIYSIRFPLNPVQNSLVILSFLFFSFFIRLPLWANTNLGVSIEIHNDTSVDSDWRPHTYTLTLFSLWKAEKPNDIFLNK